MPNRFRFLLLALALLALGYVAARFTTFDTDPLTLLPRKMPEVEGLRLFQEHFGREIDLILALEGEDAEAVEAAAADLCDHLREVDGLVARVDWEAPGTERPALYGELVAWVWMNGNGASLQALAERLAAGHSAGVIDRSIAALTSGLEPTEVFRASQDPLGLTDFSGEPLAFGGNGPFSFASEDGLCRVLFVDAPGELYDYRETIPWLERLRAEVKDWQAGYPDLRVEETGRAPYIAEIAGDMRHEMVSSVGLTMVVIVGLFWFAYRRLLPLVYLVICLALTFLVALAVGALFYERLGASSVGFAAILIGLVVDYGFILYQETRTGGADARKAAAPGILWAALTTAAVFAGLNLSSLPGASQLGTLIAAGVLAGAIIMLGVFPWLLTFGKGHAEVRRSSPAPPPVPRGRVMAITFALGAVFTILLTLKGVPGISASAEALRPRHSPALRVFERLGARLSTRENESVRVVIAAESDAGLRAALAKAENAVAPFTSAGFSLSTPLALVPDRDAIASNRGTLAELVEQWPRLRSEADAAGLSEDALDLASETFASWKKSLAGAPDADLFPDSETSRWLLGKVLARVGKTHCALANLSVPPEASEPEIEAALEALRNGGAKAAGWEHLRPAILRLMKREVLRVLLPMAVILAVMLLLAFRNLRGLWLSAATIAFGGAGLLAVMAAAGLRWNLINLAGVPLLLGAGLDYSIHMQLALKRADGNRREVWRSTGRALLLCGLSTATGFGTLSFSANAGAASLGVVCAVGITVTMLGAVFLLPLWWGALGPKSARLRA